MEFHYFRQPIGYWISDIDPELLEPVRKEIAEFQLTLPTDSPHGINHKFDLVGSRDYVADLVQRHIAQYNRDNNYPNRVTVLNEPRPLKLYNLWVNFMSRYQYEPIHDHGGVMSFVMWLRVPYTMASEAEARPYVPREYNTSGGFGLHATNSMGRLQHIVLPVDETWENRICLFPARMQHSVFPFYSSDELRISIAGNFFFDSSEQGRLR